VKEFKKNGYLIKSGLIDKTVISKIKDDIYYVFNNVIHKDDESQPKEKPITIDRLVEKVYLNDYEAFLGSIRVCQNLISLIELSVDKKICSVLKNIGLNKPVQSTPPMLMINSSRLSKKNSHYKAPPHQDWRSIQGSMDSIVVWIPLVEVSVELGSLKVVPSSHLGGLKRTVKDEWFRKLEYPPDDDKFIDVEMNEGDALFFSTFLIHKSGDISSDSIRWSAQFRYNNLEDDSFIKNRYPNPYQIKINEQIINQEFFESIIEQK